MGILVNLRAYMNRFTAYLDKGESLRDEETMEWIKRDPEGIARYIRTLENKAFTPQPNPFW